MACPLPTERGCPTQPLASLGPLLLLEGLWAVVTPFLLASFQDELYPVIPDLLALGPPFQTICNIFAQNCLTVLLSALLRQLHWIFLAYDGVCLLTDGGILAVLEASCPHIPLHDPLSIVCSSEEAERLEMSHFSFTPRLYPQHVAQLQNFREMENLVFFQINWPPLACHLSVTGICSWVQPTCLTSFFPTPPISQLPPAWSPSPLSRFHAHSPAYG